MTEEMRYARLIFKCDDLNDEVEKIAAQRVLQKLSKLSEKIKDVITDLSKESVDSNIIALIFQLEDLIIEVRKIVFDKKIQELSNVLEEFTNVIVELFKMYDVDAKWLHP
ncbi:TPA: hypothetical protein ACGO4I_002276 [Streptococcus suis]